MSRKGYARMIGTKRLAVWKLRWENVHQIICFRYLWNRTAATVAILGALALRLDSFKGHVWLSLENDTSRS